MNRSQLIEILAKRHHELSFSDVEASVHMILEMMQLTLEQGRRIEIRGFGSFENTFQNARIGRNPANGVQVEIPAKHVPRFKPGKDLREKANAGRNSGVPACVPELIQAHALPSIR